MNFLFNRLLLPVIILVFLPLAVFSQSKRDSVAANKFSVVRTDSISTTLAGYLDETTSKHFQDPSLPRFLIKDHTDTFVFGLGGYVSAMGYYNYGNIRNPSYVVNQIEVPTNYYSADLFDLYMGQTRLFFKLLGKTRHGLINAYIETDFLNDGQIMRLRHAYIEMFGIKVGKSWTTYRDDETPTTIDPEGPVSLSGRRVPLVAYTYQFKNNLKLSMAAEFSQRTTATMPNKDEGGHHVYSVLQSYPDFPISLSYTNDRFHIFGGVMGRITKFTEYEDWFSPRLFYSAQVSGNVSFYKTANQNHKFYFHAIYADGMTDCLQDMDGIGLNIIVDRDRNSGLFSVPIATGYHIGYQAQWGKGNQINVVFSQAMILNHNESYGYNDLYKKGSYLAVNYLRTILTYGIVGVEFLGGRRENLDGVKGYDFRFNLLLRYDF